MDVRIRRAYDPPGRGDGQRVLVDRVWPRGVSKAALALDEWQREIAPSTPLRQWFGHDPARWERFEERYFAELDDKPELVQALLARARKSRVTLVYSAKDTEHNQAVALRAYLERMAGRGAASPASRRPPRTPARDGARPSPGSRRAPGRGSRTRRAPRSSG